MVNHRFPLSHSGKITGLRVLDVRFSTSLSLDGSDAMNPDPDYSAAYVVLTTDRGDGIEGHGLTFTIGRGNDIVAVAIEALRPGDKVVTRDNGLQEIRWIGSKAMSWADLMAAPHMKPVLITQGSLGNGLPERDKTFKSKSIGT